MTFLGQVRLLFASILEKYIAGGAMTKKYKAHKALCYDLTRRHRIRERRLTRARRGAKQENSSAVRTGNYNRPRDDDLVVMLEAYETAKEKRDLSPTNEIPDTAKKCSRLPSIRAVSYAPENALGPAPPRTYRERCTLRPTPRCLMKKTKPSLPNPSMPLDRGNYLCTLRINVLHKRGMRKVTSNILC